VPTLSIGGGTPVDTGKCVAAVLTNGGDDPDLYDFLEVVVGVYKFVCVWNYKTFCYSAQRQLYKLNAVM
jgi:hypothetical protein